MAQPDPILQTTLPPTPAAGYSQMSVNTSGVPVLVGSTGAITSMSGLNGWYDVTSYGVLPGNAAATNVTAFNALLTLAPNGSTIYFPGGIYNFNAGITVPAKKFTFQGQIGQLDGQLTMLQLGTATTGFFTLTTLQWYTQFRDIGFFTSTTQTSGAMVSVPSSNVGVNFWHCAFGTNGGNMFDCIDFIGDTGQGTANQSVIDGCSFTGFSNHGVHVDSTGSSLTMVNSTANGTSPAAAACVFASGAGAIQVDNCDLVGAVNNMLISPATGRVAASIYVTNTYMDNSTGSCLKINGAGASVRCRFIGCSFTLASTATNFSAIEISSSGTTLTTMASGIDFSDCSVLNTFGTALTGTNGFNITGASDFTIDNCRIQGWVNGIQITPAGAAGFCRPQITNCLIGGAAAGLTGVIGTGVLLNAGSFTYGSIIISGNNFVGVTTAAVTDNSTVISTGQKNITSNLGMSLPGGVAVIAAATTFTADAIIAALTTPVPLGGLQVGTTFRIKAVVVASATSTTMTLRPRIGTAGTTADALPCGAVAIPGSLTVTTGTTIFEAQFTIRTLGSSGVAVGSGWALAENAATTNTIVVPSALTSITVNTTVANILTVSLQASTGTGTILSATVEVVRP